MTVRTHFPARRPRPAAICVAALAFFAGLSASAVAGGAPLPPGGAAILSWTPEQQAFGYRNMEKIDPARVIRRGPHVRQLPKAATQIDPAWTWRGRSYDVASYMTRMRTSGVIVLKDGKIVLERYGLGRRPSDRWTSFSVAKSVTSTLIGAAIQDGYIKSLDAPVTDYIPELKGSAYDGVTVRQLLTMTSGVKWNEDYTDPHSDVAQAGESILEPGVNPIVSYMRHLPRADPPGSKWVYKTGETDLAGILLSNAVHRPLADYLSEKIWAPLGMEQDGVWVEDVAGHERGGCCISMTLRDYARFGQFMLEDGKAAGARVLPPGWVADATSEHEKLPPTEGNGGYGYFWWLFPGGYAAEGIFGQEVFVCPKDRVVIAINSAWRHADNDEDWAAQAAFAEALRAAANPPHELPVALP
ncbi:MAG TPA: serine hydrolase [Caulobacteraceae bacterium]|nr:serine hydrolase [Caulobacteraceae bacterium]